MGRPAKTATANLNRAQKTEQLLQLVVAGQPITKAAEQLGLTYATAFRWYQAALRKVYEDNTELRERTLGKELKTLDLLQRALWPAALRGHVRSVEVMLSILDRRAKYLGLDAAIKVQFESARVDDALTKIGQIIDGEVTTEAAPLLRVVPEAK